MIILSKIRHTIVSIVRQIVSEIVNTELTIHEMQRLALESATIGISDIKILDNPLIVSLTTYSKRIYDVHLTIESLMQQTIKANRIILWLDENEFDDSNIPSVLKEQVKRGLEICFCKNLKSYKKIIPTLQDNLCSTIVTVDDDVIYPNDMLERMIKAYKKDEKCIYYCRGRIIGKKGKSINPYNKWKMVEDSNNRFDVIPTGIGGVFYPAGCFNKEVLNEDVFMSLCPNADDIWLRAMTLMNGFPCKLISYSGTFRYSFVNIDKNQGFALNNQNLWNNSNDKQFLSVFLKYNLLNKI